MGDLNSIEGVVKILETPKQTIFNKNISVTQFRALFPQVRNNLIVTLIFWGNLAVDVGNYYKVNDYILIEGYLSLKNKPSLNSKDQSVEIKVLKVYPFFFNSDQKLNRT